MILFVSLMDISDSLFILSLEDDDDLIGIGAAIIPILNPRRMRTYKQTRTNSPKSPPVVALGIYNTAAGG